MTFNWPDVPFSGTEVDAFVAEYKSFAQDVLDSYDTWGSGIGTDYAQQKDIGYTALPYHTKENVKIYLESALVYSAFIIKQRAGNLGPGTDFTLGNSPLNVELDEPQTKRVNEKLNCSWEDGSFEMCFGDGDGGPPFGPGFGPPPEVDDGGDAPPGDEPPPPPDDEDPPPEDPPSDPPKPDDDSDCPKKRNAQNGLGEKAVEYITKTALRHLILAIARNVESLGLVTGNSGMELTGSMLAHYILGSGSVYTTKPYSFKTQLLKYMNRNVGTNTQLNLSAAARAAYGMSETDTAYLVDTSADLWFRVSLGSATVISDGTETTQTLTGLGTFATNFNNIKKVIDDYDFNYAWTVVRSGVNGDFAGTALDDAGIVSGPDLCPENHPAGDDNDPTDDERNVCEALVKNGNHGLDYAIRYPVTEAHGDGCKTWDPSKAAETGKPFGIFITL